MCVCGINVLTLGFFTMSYDRLLALWLLGLGSVSLMAMTFSGLRHPQLFPSLISCSLIVHSSFASQIPIPGPQLINSLSLRHIWVMVEGKRFE